MTRRRGILIVGVLLAVMATILVLSDPAANPYERPPLDPRGTGPQGTKALIELIEAEGADARVGGEPNANDDVILQLRDTWSGDAAADLRRWVDDGGTLITTDPRADLAAGEGTPNGIVSRAPGDCEVDALQGVDRIDPGLVPTFDLTDASSSCFTVPSSEIGDGAGIDVRERGFGRVVSMSSPEPLVNAALGRDDNAVLAVTLLVPFDGVGVRILDPNRLRSDDEVSDGTVLGALPERGSQAVSQLVIAFLAWALIRGRRLGHPVTEELPVPLPASDLVLASGRLLDRNGDVADAAERLRRRARRDLGVATGLGAHPDPTELADALSTRAGLDPDLVRAALLVPVTDESGLVTMSTHLDRLRRDLHQ